MRGPPYGHAVMTGHRTTALVLAALGTVLAVVVPGAAAPAAPAVGLIAFETPSGIHLIGSDGTGLRRLANTKPGDQNPHWSPDGSRIVFWSDADSDGEIYVIDADGSNRRRLTEDDPESEYGPTDQYPAWSPDGRLIAFESYRRGDDWHIWVMRPNGAGLRRLTPDGRGGYSADWSPDGKHIVYTAGWAETSLAVVDLTGRTRALESLTADEDWAPTWSPDGERIAFTSTAEHKKPELYVVAAKGGTPTRLTRNTASDADPVRSADGEHIAFQSGRAGFDEVYVMRADGTDQRRVTRVPTEYACCPAWRP
jgi:Tol biopolymer transport system component